MTRRYHRWTDEERAKVKDYVDRIDYPTSEYNLVVLATDLGVSEGSVRGAVIREMKRQRELDVREE